MEVRKKFEEEYRPKNSANDGTQVFITTSTYNSSAN